MDIRIVEKGITLQELKDTANEFYTVMIKGVVDVEKETLAVGGEYHSDANEVLLGHGSEQKDVWGFNYYFNKPKEDAIEYVSLINIRPAQDNHDMEVHNTELRARMKEIIDKKIEL